MRKDIMPLTVLILIAAIVLAVNLIASMGFQSVKLDLTEEKIYTLSKGSVNVVKSLEDDVQAKFYYSKTAVAEQPFLKNYATRILQLLNEYETASKGSLKLEIIDPRPDTEEEEWAERYGLQAFPGGKSGEPIYMGLVLKDESGNEASIPVFTPDRENSLEYDITKAIYNVGHPEKKTVGILSSLDVMGGPPPSPYMPAPNTAQPWVFVNELRNEFNVEKVDASVESIPDDIDLLLIIHPKNLNESTLYAIDQYVLSGGRAIVFIDPFCENEHQAMAAQMQQNMQMMMRQSFSSNIPRLLKAWGLELMGEEEPKVVADANLATTVQTGRSLEQMIVWLSLGKENRDDQEIITSRLEQVMMATAGGLKKATVSENIKLTPLLETTSEASTIDSMMLKFGMDPKSLRGNYKAGSSKIPMAYKITGKFKTAFPDGKPEEEAEEGEEEKKQEDKKPAAAHLVESKEETTLIVFSDVDMISDRYSVRKMNFFGQQIASMINDNLSLLANAVENLSGSRDLIALRSRGSSHRPFTRVQEIERNAQQQWLKEEELLNQKLQQANQRINELQRGSEEKRVLDKAFMSEIENLRKERANTRRELRKVRRELREDVENLGARVKFINIALIPLLITIVSITIGILRSFRRRVES
jgi:ABC-type uncharacterized transport system involved in gliding motility auxiliary subunit